jgi:transketolase
MRTAFIKELTELAEEDKNIWLINGDLGYSVLEEFRDRFPDRFINAGVAEQNMMGVAAGLALSGKTVFVYSIANFPTFRCLEQIRNDVCYHNANVKIISIGAGYTYGSHGYTHHGVEDIAVMRVLPNMSVVAPGDPIESSLLTKYIANHQGAFYMRLGKAGEPSIHSSNPKIESGKLIECKHGRDAVIISTGNMLANAVEVSRVLRKHDKDIGVFSCPFLEPIDTEGILNIAKSTLQLITLEEHGIGGLGTIVSEILAKENLPVKFIPLFLNKQIPIHAGNQSQMQEDKGLSVKKIIERLF